MASESNKLRDHEKRRLADIILPGERANGTPHPFPSNFPRRFNPEEKHIKAMNAALKEVDLREMLKRVNTGLHLPTKFEDHERKRSELLKDIQSFKPLMQPGMTPAYMRQYNVESSALKGLPKFLIKVGQFFVKTSDSHQILWRNRAQSKLKKVE